MYACAHTCAYECVHIYFIYKIKANVRTHVHMNVCAFTLIYIY